jgi:hypothetical protein
MFLYRILLMKPNNYGYVFNDITISNNIVSKKHKNEYGKTKINCEKEFYIFVFSNNVDFNMPKLLNYNDGIIEIEYIPNSFTLTKVVNKENTDFYIYLVKKHLHKLHSITISIDRNTLIADLNIELKEKVFKRYNEFDWKSNATFSSIKSVNGLPIKNIFYYAFVIKTSLTDLLFDRNYYHLIHGDTHLGNILTNSANELWFIDPRGYFGETKLFGLVEYDYAKLMAGLSGTSIFDEMEFDTIEINNGNLEIDFVKDYEYIFETNKFDKITTLFCLSIWLSNNHCFSNVNKKIVSLMTAYYYCEKYL